VHVPEGTPLDRLHRIRPSFEDTVPEPEPLTVSEKFVLAVPVPERATVSGLDGALLLTVTVAVSAAAAVGAN
jgi:hypothetical protein